MITMARDSATPSCHPIRTITAITLKFTPIILITEKSDTIKFKVVNTNTIKANKIEISIPYIAFDTKALSVGIHLINNININI